MSEKARTWRKTHRMFRFTIVCLTMRTLDFFPFYFFTRVTFARIDAEFSFDKKKKEKTTEEEEKKPLSTKSCVYIPPNG